jgi:Ca2+-transporting ATPase
MCSGVGVLKWHELSAESVEHALRTDMQEGLSEQEAEERLKRTGLNQLEEGEKLSAFALLLGQFKDFMVMVLVVATLISGLLGEYTDAITIIAIIILNALLGFIQEYRAEKSLQALKELTAPTAHVIRNGELVQIPAHEVVPGDVVFIEEGDRVPADLRLFETKGLYIEESALTGESHPVLKDEEMIQSSEEVSLGDQHNMAFMGTLVTRGSGQGMVVATGMDTQMGQIAALISTTESVQTPLQLRLAQLGKVLISVALALTALVVLVGIWHGHDTYTMFLAGVSLAVAAIPEGLPAIVTVALALGVQRMIKRRAIVRQLPAVETLGSTSVICSDKTGTLTQNKMTVTRLWIDQTEIEVSGVGYEPYGEFSVSGKRIELERKPTVRQMIEMGVLCSNAMLEQVTEREGLFRKENYWDINGDPTEGALVVTGAKGNLWKKEVDSLYPRLEEFPFDSVRKMMSVIVRYRGGDRYVITKGAPEIVLDKCTRVIWNGREHQLTQSLKDKILAANDLLAAQALRNLAIAYRKLSPTEQITNEEEAEQKLVFVGMFGMIDPPREEVKQAILECKQAGIKTVMITGDYQRTAEAIARQLGLLSGNELVISGRELNQLSDQKLYQMVDNIAVFARVSPEHKLRIVKAWQKKGHVVAMTGDGVNDAPAIKAADIGIAMGMTGTDVAKEASALVLSDDNFATIKAAIEEGRTIYENIRKFIRYILASNVGEILVMLMAMMLAMPLPLVPIQILWVNLVTDGLPAIALGVDRAEGDVLKQPPRDRKENIFARGLGWKIISRGFLIGLVTLAAFWLSLNHFGNDLVTSQTIAFATLVMAQLIHVFDCRSNYSIFHRNPLENGWLVLAVMVSAIMLISVIHIDVLQPIFKTVALSVKEWLFILCMAAIPSVILSLSHIFKKSVN